MHFNVYFAKGDILKMENASVSHTENDGPQPAQGNVGVQPTAAASLPPYTENFIPGSQSTRWTHLPLGPGWKSVGDQRETRE